MTEIERASRIIANQLIGEGMDAYKDIRADHAASMGNFLWDVIEGMTVEEALEKQNQHNSA